MSQSATTRASSGDSAGLGPTLTFLFAVSCGALAANLYYAQPLVSLMGTDPGLPVAAGFGVREPEQAEAIAKRADAVVVGSAIVDAMHEGGIDGATGLVKRLASAVHAARR